MPERVARSQCWLKSTFSKLKLKSTNSVKSFWPDFSGSCLRMLVDLPGNDKEVDSDLLSTAFEGQPLVEVR